MASPVVIKLEDEGPKLPMVIGLVAPTGTKMDALEKQLTTGLGQANRDVEVVNVPDILRRAAMELPRDVDGPEDERIAKMREAGILLRYRSRRGEGKSGDILALWALKEMHERLEPLKGPAAGRMAFIIRSLKHPDEAKLLRGVFGPWFFLIAGYSPASVRHENLARKIDYDRKVGSWKKFVRTAEDLAEADSGSPDEPLGPQVKATFHLADAFIDVTKNEIELTHEVDRMMKIIFGQLLQTPTPHEAAMAQAHVAAIQSGFLSRQVGAVVTMPKSGEIVATGYNEVPKFGGGPYLTGDDPDARDNVLKKDDSYVLKEGLVRDMLARLVEAGWISPDLLGDPDCEVLPKDRVERKEKVAECAERLAKQALEGKAPLARAEAMDVLEFHRAVHAEQAAISACARRGVQTVGKWLYVTTFPCHICAKHIVAAGIERVVYVEPYPKSYAEELHKDAIEVDPASRSADHASFEPFMGIAPRRYEQLFIVRPGERRGPRGESSPEDAWARGIPRWETLWEFQPSYSELLNRIGECVAEAPQPSELSDESWQVDTSEEDEDL